MAAHAHVQPPRRHLAREIRAILQASANGRAVFEIAAGDLNIRKLQLSGTVSGCGLAFSEA